MSASHARAFRSPSRPSASSGPISRLACVASREPSTKRVEISISLRTVLTILGVIAVAWAFVAARQAVL
jgi:hypothetical protein